MAPPTFADGETPRDGATPTDSSGAPDGPPGGDLRGTDALGPAPALARPPQRFAIIGDYGVNDPDELAVSTLVKGWNPDFVITTGDNNYLNGDRATIDLNIGKYYASFIGGYQGAFGPGSIVNRFWPSIGNHDFYGMEKLQPYLDYFPQLPGNKRYYDVTIGRIHLFALNSEEPVEPDGITPDSTQAAWLRQRLAASTACWKIVYFHQPPYSSGPYHNDKMRWAFKAMGADVVVSGHEHYYERIEKDGLLFLINGLGGAKNRFDFPTPIPESKVRFSDDFGAQLAHADAAGLTLEFWSVKGVKVDAVTLLKNCP